MEGFETFIKRDDLSSFDLSGNKVRKLEFLLAEAIKGSHDCPPLPFYPLYVLYLSYTPIHPIHPIQGNHDCVITAGGVQSNHCRATAVAARQLGMDPYLILRQTKASAQEEELGLTGNLLLDRLVGATIKTVTISQYAQFGSDFLLEQLAEQLRSEG